jgi:hypothetical protein
MQHIIIIYCARIIQLYNTQHTQHNTQTVHLYKHVNTNAYMCVFVSTYVFQILCIMASKSFLPLATSKELKGTHIMLDP